MSKLYIGTQEIKPSILSYGLKKVVIDGVLDRDDEVISLKGINKIGDYTLRYVYREDEHITSVDFSNIVEVSGFSGCNNTFSNCTNLASVDFSNLELISNEYGTYQMFSGCSSLTSISIPKLKAIEDNYGSYQMFYNCTSLVSADLKNLQCVFGSYACQNMFSGCTSLQSVDLSNLTLVKGINRTGNGNGYVLSGLFSGCTNLASISLRKLLVVDYNSYGYSIFGNCTNLQYVNLTNLIRIGYAQRMFEGCTSLTQVYFRKLNGLGSMQSAFQNCTNLKDLYFPALTANSFSYDGTNTFRYMLQGVDGCTIHLPEYFDPNDPNKVYDITALTGYPNFSGTNTQIVFDQVFEANAEVDLSGLDSKIINRALSEKSRLASLFHRCENIYSANLSSFKDITGYQTCYTMFRECKNLKFVDLSNLITIVNDTGSCCYYMFYGCTELETVDLSSLTKIIGPNACGYMFNNCNKLKNIDLSNLETIGNDISSGYECTYMFDHCGLDKVVFSKLNKIYSPYACSYMFRWCTNLTDIYFPALTSTSFGSNTSQFRDMIQGTTGVTLHFPSNLDPQTGCTTISSLDTYPRFGQWGTVLLFDLPATE